MSICYLLGCGCSVDALWYDGRVERYDIIPSFTSPSNGVAFLPVSQS